MSATNPYAPPQGAVRDIASGEGVEPAERVTRLAAAFLDGIIAFAMIWLPFMIAMLASGVMVEPSSVGADGSALGEASGVALAIGGLLSFIGLIAWIWLTVQNVARNGQTIAKKMLGIKVIRTDGSKASLGRIFWLRNVVNGLLGIIPLYGLIDILFIFGAQRQCIHDKLADTIVVRA